MRYILTVAILLCTCTSGISQIDSLLAKSKLADRFEAVFVHTDKDAYVAGETIWLKTYLYDGVYPSAKSSAIKVQLVTGDCTILAEKIYPVIGGVAVGSVKLPATIANGRYFIKAFGNVYTNRYSQMYVAPLLVNNPATPQKVIPANYKKAAIVKLIFPNRPVAGQVNQAYVTVCDQYKQPVEVAGVLLNAENDTVASFTTNYLGLSELHLVPSVAENYTVMLAGDTANKYAVSESAVNDQGVTMTVFFKDSTYHIYLNATQGMAAGNYSLLAEYNYNLLNRANVHFSNNGAYVKIAAAQLPTGITRLALLNAGNNAVCERYVFSANPSGMINPGEPDIDLRLADTAKSSIKFSVTDTVENTISINALNAEYDFGTVNRNDNIVNHFLLTSYFTQYNPSYRGIIGNLAQTDINAINGLLATQPLIKPSWQQIINASKDEHADFATPGYITLKGTVAPDGFKALPKDPSLTVIFSTADSSRNFSIVPLDDAGKFEINDMVFTDSLTMFYKLNAKTPKAVKLSLEVNPPASLFSQQKNTWQFLHNFAPVQMQNLNELKNEAGEKQKLLFLAAIDTIKANELANVTVHSVRGLREKTKALNDKYTTTVFSRDASATFNMLEEPVRPGQSVIDYLKVFGRRMTITESGGDGNIVKPGWGKGIPYTLFADEGRTTFGYLKGLDLHEVALIKVYEDHFVLADDNGPAIAVYLRKGSESFVPIDPQMKKVKIAGYSPTKSFTIPNNPNTGSLNKQAFLSTFYWNPSLCINAAQQNNIEFANISNVKKAIITLQGMGSDGKLIYWQKTVLAK